MSEMAKVFEDRHYTGVWRVEWVKDDGGCEVAIFSSPQARERTIRYADRQYGNAVEIAIVAVLDVRVPLLVVLGAGAGCFCFTGCGCPLPSSR
jgi:hypothetical protein